MKDPIERACGNFRGRFLGGGRLNSLGSAYSRASG
jgi:hypothetical protein